MVEKSQNKIKESEKPINEKEKFVDFVRTDGIIEDQSYLRYFSTRLEKEQRSLDFRIFLRDIIKDPYIYQMFKENPSKCLECLRVAIFSELRYNIAIKELLAHEKIKEEYLHIIIDPLDVEDLIPTVEDFTADLSKLVGKYSLFKGRFMNIGLDRENHFHSLTFRCRLCGEEFTIKYPFDIVINRYKPVNKCQNCSNTLCLDIVKDEPFERRLFLIEDLDLRTIGNIFTCRILRNAFYFIEKEKGIDLNEEVEILGILRRDHSDFFNRKPLKEFEYYIEIFDIFPKKAKLIDEKIINLLKEKLRKPDYNERLIDSINYLTYLIDLQFPIKLSGAMSIVSGGSYNTVEKVRDTLNLIVAGGGSTYKSSIMRSIQNIVGIKTFYRYEGAKITEAGLIGSTTRQPDKVKPVIRYGFLAIYSDGTICFDEAQEIIKKNFDIFNLLRCVEDGNNGFIQDTVHFNSPCWESIIIVQNYFSQNGFYDAGMDLYDNLGWPKANADSLLQRFDLYYNVPIPDIFTEFRIHKNLELMSENKMHAVIAEDLQISDYVFPSEKMSLEEKIIYVQFNYLQMAKSLYRTIEVPKELRNAFGKLYRETLKARGVSKNTDVTIRSLNSAFKVIRALAALRLSNIIEDRDYNYFLQNCVKLIIPFRNSEIMNKEHIDITTIFKETFEMDIMDAAKNNSENIRIDTHINAIRAYIKTHYFTGAKEQKFDVEIDGFMPNDITLSKNWKYRKLLENNNKWLEDKGFTTESIKGEGTYFKKITGKAIIKETPRTVSLLETGKIDMDKIFVGHPREQLKKLDKFLDRLKELFESNNWKTLEKESVIQVIDVDENDLSLRFIKDAIDDMIKNGVLSEIKPGFIKFK